jgi:MFS family permease
MRRDFSGPAAGGDGAERAVAGGVDSARAWTIALAGLLANAACWGTIFSFAAFLDSMKDEFHASLGATALIFALPTFLSFGLGIVAGPVADRYGPRRIVACGAVLMGTGLLITSRAPNLPVAVAAYGIGVGLGVACYLVPVTACIGGWFVRRRAIALGVSSSGIGFGTLLLVPIVERMIDGVGWRTAYVVLAIVCATSLAITALIAKRPPNARPVGRPSLRRIREAAAPGPFAQLYVGGLLFSAALYVPFVFLVRFAKDHGIASSSAALLLSVLGASNIVSRLGTTGLAGRVGAVRMFMACFALLPIGLGLWLVVGGSYAGLVVFALLLGVSHGGYVALSPEVAAQLFGVTNLGSVLGALWTAPGVAGLIGPVLAGVLIDAAGYTVTIAVAVCLGVLAVLVQRTLWSISRQQPSFATLPVEDADLAPAGPVS